MALFIRRFSKMMSMQKFFKGDKKNKFRTKNKRDCYYYGMYGHYIANCHYEHSDEEDDKKKKKRRRRRRRSYKKDKHYKKKSYGEAHIGKELNSDNESSDSNNDHVTTVAMHGVQRAI
jgi:hypothetical protein